ncbi:MAG: hypothetical protein NC311_10005 [Muribaculaceae bacterium]|nr:hypothetical protein [Muribaculaceae bacterium]
MTLMTEDARDKALDAAWKIYAQAQDIINTLGDIGLEVDGANAGRPGSLSGLFGITTKACDIILNLLGVPHEAPWLDQASMVLADLAPHKNSDRLPGQIRTALENIADTALKKSMLPIPDGAKSFEVTLSMSGSVTVYTADENSAMSAANNLDTGTLIRAACWDSPNATDAYENP